MIHEGGISQAPRHKWSGAARQGPTLARPSRNQSRLSLRERRLWLRPKAALGFAATRGITSRQRNAERLSPQGVGRRRGAWERVKVGPNRGAAVEHPLIGGCPISCLDKAVQMRILHLAWFSRRRGWGPIFRRRQIESEKFLPGGPKSAPTGEHSEGLAVERVRAGNSENRGGDERQHVAAQLRSGQAVTQCTERPHGRPMRGTSRSAAAAAREPTR